MAVRATLLALVVAYASGAAIPEEELVRKASSETGQLRASLTMIQNQGILAAKAAKEAFEKELAARQQATSRVEAENGAIDHATSVLRGTNAMERTRAVALLSEVRELTARAAELSANFTTARAFSARVSEEGDLSNDTRLQVLEELDAEEAMEEKAKERDLVEGKAALMQLSSRSLRAMDEAQLVRSLQQQAVELQAAWNASNAEARAAYDKALAAEADRHAAALQEQEKLNATRAAEVALEGLLQAATANLKRRRDQLLGEHQRVGEFAEALGSGRGLLSTPSAASKASLLQTSDADAKKPRAVLLRHRRQAKHRHATKHRHAAHAKHRASKHRKA